MKKILCYAVLLANFLLIACQTPKAPLEKKQMPNEWFFSQRAFPYNKINTEAYKQAILETQANLVRRSTTEGYNDAWQPKGPYNINGRVTDIEMPVDDMNTIYAGSASGGIFKSNNLGDSWSSIFDESLSLSIGDLALAPSNQSIIYAGTGEANAGGGSLAYDGMGIYRSDDAGASWNHLGLDKVGSIGKIVVNPKNEDVLYVATMGRLFGNNTERGVYKSIDGGQKWTESLTISDSTGAIDLAIHPHMPDTIYAAMWERTRNVSDRTYGGATSGIYRSYDGGENWQEINNGLPTDAADKGRIGIAIAASNPNVLYAYYAKQDGRLQGLYRSNNGGDSWFTLDDRAISDVPFMWWFGKVYVHPFDENIAYATSLDMFKTSNGGENWTPIFAGAHVDHHALFVHPQNPELIINGNDGGVHLSENGGREWKVLDNIPNIQFYTCAIDYNFPERIFGGTQDNGTLMVDEGQENWEMIFGGDGFKVLSDPTNPDVIYAESQRGNFVKSINGGQSFMPSKNGISGLKNWNTPFVMDPNNPQTLYLGTDKVFKTTDSAESWQAISDIIPATTSNEGLNAYGTITALAVSALDQNIILAGTDDGMISITTNGGDDWNMISNELPLRWVTAVATDPYDELTIYASLSGFRYDLDGAHIYKSEDLGLHWEDISVDLPDVPVNDIIVDPIQTGRIYAATDVGVFFTLDGGNSWELLGIDMPNVPVIDIDFHPPTRMLLAATYGRSMYSYIIPLETPTNEIATKVFDIKIYPNPAANEIFIDGMKSKSEVNIFDLSGRHLSRHIVSPNQAIDISRLIGGEYILQIQDLAIPFIVQ